MNNFISNILKENEESIDDFFKPKNLKSRKIKFEKQKEIELKRKEEQKRIETSKFIDSLDFNEKEIAIKLLKGLELIKKEYKNKNYSNENCENDTEKYFLYMFSSLHLKLEFSKGIDYFYLLDHYDHIKIYIDLHYNEIFMTRFDYELLPIKNYEEKFNFFMDSLKKYFDLSFNTIKTF